MCVSRSSLLDAPSWLQAKSTAETMMAAAPRRIEKNPGIVSRWT